VDSVNRDVSVGAASDSLPAKVFLLLRALCQEPGRVWSKHDLLDYVWGQASTVETNVVEATVTHLRKRLADLGTPVAIRNMRNAGYWITE
jgi:DNA-binding response OmpR family regulator